MRSLVSKSLASGSIYLVFLYCYMCWDTLGSASPKYESSIATENSKVSALICFYSADKSSNELVWLTYFSFGSSTANCADEMIVGRSWTDGRKSSLLEEMASDKGTMCLNKADSGFSTKLSIKARCRFGW